MFELGREIIDTYKNRKSIIKNLSEFWNTLNNVRVNSLEITRDNKKIVIIQVFQNNYSGLYIEKVKYYYGGRI